MLQSSQTALASQFDVIGLDLDGVVYIGSDAVPHAASSLESALKLGARLAYVTNNASRTPLAVAEHLRSFGLQVPEAAVVTSSQAAASLLVRRLVPASRVYVMGGDGLVDAIDAVGLTPVVDLVSDVDAVVQGYGPEMPWKRVVHGARLVKSGLPWVATNTDLTIPLSGGVGPGNGALVQLVSEFSGRDAEVAGKPYRPLFDEVASRMEPARPLFVGDRLDTDIRGANSAGWSSLLVRTGVTDLEELLRAEQQDRPCYLSSDLRGLLVPHERPVVVDEKWQLGGWASFVDDDGRLRVEGTGAVDNWWRCVAAAAWSYRDAQTSYPQAGIANLDQLRPPR